MKNKFKSLVLSTLFLLPLASSSQWVTKTIDNKIDLPYRIAYCGNASQTAFLKLEKVGDQVAFYLIGGYHCEEYPKVDIALVIGELTSRYTVSGSRSGDSKAVFFLDDILDSTNAVFLMEFKKCSKMVLRINESVCTDDYYEFNMSGSTRAVEFISKEN